MQEPAPKGTIHLVDEDAKDLHGGVAKEVGKITGQPTSSQSLNPNDHSSLEAIRKDLTDKGHEVIHDITHVATTVTTNDEASRIRIAKEKSPASIVSDRWHKLNKKAA